MSPGADPLDPLTGLPGRVALEGWLEDALSDARANRSEHALCYLDVERLKIVNFTCGLGAGDELLRRVGRFLLEWLGTGDGVVRIGGGIFALLMPHCAVGDAERRARALQREVEQLQFTWNDEPLAVAASIGVVPVDHDSPGVSHLLTQADYACHTARDPGQNQVQVLQPGGGEVEACRREMRWVGHLGRALSSGGLCLAAQPVMRLRGASRGERMELLLRIRDAAGKVIPAGAFLPAAEKFGLMRQLDRWVIDTALQWFQANPRALERLDLCMVNLSGQSLGDSGYQEFVVERFRRSNVPAERFCFEITETAAIADLEAANRFMESLIALGCRFALDDFGTGLASFAYLKNLSAQTIKIDGQFVSDLGRERVASEMVDALIRIARITGKSTVAECVESDEVLEHLVELGVDYAQGYAVGMPELLA